MKLSPQQEQIIQYEDNCKINAVAGSGKTTTLREYARIRPGKKLLYIGFNRTVKEEAQRKFIAAGVSNTRIETAHSLAYAAIMKGKAFKLKSAGYKTAEIAEFIQMKGGLNDRLAIANHVGKYAGLFCNSAARKVEDIDYLSFVTDPKAKEFVTFYRKPILDNTRLFLAGMLNGRYEITHDFYLKLFQLSNPTLNYDTVLFDEGQDASVVMLDIFLNQQATKVIVGDTHQQIYGWRQAINSLDLVDYPTFDLTTSYRFPSYIAQLATAVLDTKKPYGFSTPAIEGLQSNPDVTGRAVIGRTNIGILAKAIEYLIETRLIENLYFEGNFNSYVYSDSGGSLYDVLNLFLCKHESIKDPLLRGMQSFSDLTDYIELTEDYQLSLLVEVVQKYGSELPHFLNLIRRNLTESRSFADCIFSTVHRAKGMEYETVEVCDDYMSPDDLDKAVESCLATGQPVTPLMEEVNALYVAITRASKRLSIPRRYFPDFIRPGSQSPVQLLETRSRPRRERNTLVEAAEPEEKVRPTRTLQLT